MHAPSSYVGSVVELWRYPVKSMQGEPLASADFSSAGIVGDRRWAVVSSAAAVGKPRLRGSERARMLRWRACLKAVPQVVSPAGEAWPLPSSEALQALQHEVASEGAQLRWEHSPELPMVDVRPVSVVSVATLRFLAREPGFDARRLRTNVVIEMADDQPFAEERLSGARLRFSAGRVAGPENVSLAVKERVPRCGVVAVDPESGEVDRTLLRWLARERAGRVAMYAAVSAAGTVRVGDAVMREV